MIAFANPSTFSHSSHIPPAAFLGPPPRAPIQPTRYDAKGRQIQYIETPAQRRERLAFLATREWARRVAQWVHESTAVPHDVDVPAYNPGYTSPSRSTTLAPIDEADVEIDDDEPHIFYTASPKPVSSPISTPSPSTRGHRRQTSTLLSIREED